MLCANAFNFFQEVNVKNLKMFAKLIKIVKRKPSYILNDLIKINECLWK